VCYYYIGVYIIIMSWPGGGGGDCAGGGGGNSTTCFAIFSLHGMIPISINTDDGKYHVDAADLPEGVSVVVSPNNMGYPELVDDTGGSTYITTFLRWARRGEMRDHTPDTLSTEFNAFEKEQMDRSVRQMKYERTFDRVAQLGSTPLGLTRKLTYDLHGSLYASHTVVDIVKTIKKEAEITWMTHNTGVSPGKLFMPGGTSNQCLFYFPNADDDKISNKLFDWKRNMGSRGDATWKSKNTENIELCNMLSLTFEARVLTIQFELGEKENENKIWFVVSFNDLFEQLKRVISFSLGADFVREHMSNCCIADSACSVFAVPRSGVPGAPRQEITILGPKTDSPASASADGSTTLMIDVHDVGSQHPRSFWEAYHRLAHTYKQQQVTAPCPAGSTLHELVIPQSLTSFLPHLSTSAIIHRITPILNDEGNVIGMTIIYKNPDGLFTEEVVMYEPIQPTVSRESGDLGWSVGKGGELVVVDDASLPHHALLDDDDSGFSHCANQDDSPPHLSQLLSPVSSQVFSPLSSPVHMQEFLPGHPPYGGGRRCSKKNKNNNRSMKNRNRTMKNRNRTMKKMKTIRNKRKRKNRSVRRRG
jgi:hypothetical protein